MFISGPDECFDTGILASDEFLHFFIVIVKYTPLIIKLDL